MSNFTPKKVNQSSLKVHQKFTKVNSQLSINQQITPKVNQVNQVNQFYVFLHKLDNSIYIFYLYIYYNIIGLYFFIFIEKKFTWLTLVNFSTYYIKYQTVITKIW